MVNTTPNSVGDIKYNSQPAFNMYVLSNITNVTGDGTVYTIIYQGVTFDHQNNVTLASGKFTAPVTGKYQFLCNTKLLQSSVVATTVLYTLVTTNRSYNLYDISETALHSSLSNGPVMNAGVIANMTAGDTATVTLQVSGTTKTIGILGSVNGSGTGYFGGRLVC